MKKIFILISVILVVITIGGCFWYWQNSESGKKNNESQSNEFETKNEKQVIPAQMSDAERFITDMMHGDYKIFSDKLFAFSFQYPDDWEYEIKKDSYNPNHYSLTFTNKDLEKVTVYPTGRDGEFLVCRKSSAECAFRILVLFDKKVIFRSSDEYIEYFSSDFMFDNSNFMIEAKTSNKTFIAQIDRLVRSIKFCNFNEDNCPALKDVEIKNIKQDSLSLIDLNTINWISYNSPKFNFSFRYPKDTEVVERDNTIVVTFKGLNVLTFDPNFLMEEIETGSGVDWSKTKIIDSFTVNGEKVNFITHNQPEYNDDWTFPSDCSYYIFTNHSDEEKMFMVPSCVRNDYIKKLERLIVESVVFN